MKMCPYCGELFEDNCGELTPFHPEKTDNDVRARTCKGSTQSPRNPKLDGRLLLNGKPNSNFMVKE